MSANASEIRQVPAASPQGNNNRGLVLGKCDNIRTYDTKEGKVFEHRIIQAADDVYSSPGAVIVSASRKLAAPGDDVRVIVKITGYRDSYTTKAGDDVVTARVRLVAVE